MLEKLPSCLNKLMETVQKKDLNKNQNQYINVYQEILDSREE